MRSTIMALLGTAALLAIPAGDASAQTRDGLNRWVNINNVSGFRTVVTLYAVPSHRAGSNITGRDLIPGITIRPGQAYAVNFDDGRGTCHYDVRATSERTGTDWIRRNFNVCQHSHLNLGS